MKSLKFYFALLIACCFLFHHVLFAQDLYAYKYIGKSRTEVIKKYGKPAYMDKSDPSMVCMFYKKDLDQMVFVSDQNAVFQIELTKSFSSKASAVNELNKLLAQATKESFVTDTISVNEYELDKQGVNFSAMIMHNDNRSKYEVRVKAAKK